MRIVSGLLVLAAALACADPATAQTAGASSSAQRPSTPAKPGTRKPLAPPLPKPVMNIRAFGALEIEMMAASQTFKAVTGSSTMFGYGGGGEIVNFWKTLFVRGGYVTSSSTGERVFVFDNDVIETGLPITVRLSTVEIAGGWRMRLRQAPKYTPYAGGAVLLTSYSEKSDLAAESDNVQESFTGYSILGGIDMQIQKRLFATAELQYRFVPDAIGKGGISAVYGETDLGGFVARIMVGYDLLKKK